MPSWTLKPLLLLLQSFFLKNCYFWFVKTIRGKSLENSATWGKLKTKKKYFYTWSLMETKGILAISKLRKNAFKDNPGCICQFFSSQVCKKPAIFFQHPVDFKKKYFPPKLKQYHALSPFQDLK